MRRKSVSYRYVTAPNHPRAYSDGRIKEHILTAEKALGRFLPPAAVVHHIDGNKNNNQHSNLVICENSAYHNLIHMRTRAKIESGNANNRWCIYCKRWDSSDKILDMGKRGACRVECRRQFDRSRYWGNWRFFQAKNAKYRQIRKMQAEKMAQNTP